MRLIVNGEIWNAVDARCAIRQSGCHDLMIGRGGLACPDLARIIRADLAGGTGPGWEPLSWPEVAGLVEQFFRMRDATKPKYAGNRTKQWLGYLMKHYAEAGQLFAEIKRLRDTDSIGEKLTVYRQPRLVADNSGMPATSTPLRQAI